MIPHSTAPSTAPALFSVTRIAMLLTALLVALASGTNYVFSAYGPQLSSRLHLSHTQMNIVGLSGNVGVYGTSPFWGRIVDSRGPKILLVIAFVSLLVGYNGVRYLYDAGLPTGATDVTPVTFWTLAFFGFLTGIGGNGGLAGAMNSTAKSFPDGLRATTNGLVISGFGLSAFLFSTIAHVIFPGNTSEFLLVLAIGTSLPMILGYFFLRPIPLPYSDELRTLEVGHDEDEDFSVASPVVMRRNNDSQTHLLYNHHEDGDSSDEDLLEPVEYHHERSPTEYVVPGSANSLALSPTRQSMESRHRSQRSLSRRPPSHKFVDGMPNIRGTALARSGNFWVLFTITSLLSGTGLMYINNVGSISQALFAKGDPEFDDRKAAQWQATQVSTVSITNCLGRLVIGMIADFTKNQLRLPRSFCVSLVALLFIISQVTVFSVDEVKSLWKGSALLGFAYGSLFGLFPTITIEWFGLSHFSENWGFVSLAPMIGGNVFSIAFGRNLDAHAPSGSETEFGSIASRMSSIRAPSAGDSSHQCLQGRECYVDSLLLTITACSIALALALYAGWRDYKAGRGLEHIHRGRVPSVPIIFEDAEV